MKDLAGRTAVVTGAASGIGRALALALGGEGMRVVVSDIERDALGETEKALAEARIDSVSVGCDVAQADQVTALAEAAEDAFGNVHVVCNNAGVFTGGLCWEAPLSDYEWVLGVNVWGVIHGIKAFVPRILAHGEPAHVVNTASMAGMTTGPMSGAYFMSKHAVVALSESLYHELRMKEAPIGVSVVCPELVDTRIGTSDRNRPEHLARKPEELGDGPERDLVETAIKASTATGIPPAAIAARALTAIVEDRFYVFPPDDNPWVETCRSRMDDIRATRNPVLAIPGN